MVSLPYVKNNIEKYIQLSEYLPLLGLENLQVLIISFNKVCYGSLKLLFFFKYINRGLRQFFHFVLHIIQLIIQFLNFRMIPLVVN